MTTRPTTPQPALLMGHSALNPRAEFEVLDSVEKFLGGRFFQRVVEQAISDAVTAATGPWLDRKSAAAYARCSVGEIDRAADEGAFTRYVRGGTPMFKRTDLDAAIETSTWPKRSNA